MKGSLVAFAEGSQTGKYLVLELVQTLEGTGARVVQIDPPTYEISGPIPIAKLRTEPSVPGGARDAICRIALDNLRFPWSEHLPTAFSCRTTFKAFQFRPLLKYLGAAGRRLLIADEAGLGKTIEAGYIIAEEIARFGASRILVVCPSRLRRKWRAELWSRFGLSFQVVQGNQLMRALESRSPAFAHIVSMDASRTIDLDRLDRLVSARGIDLLIVDEIHRMIGRGGDILRRRFGLILSALARGFVGLSATPVQLEVSDMKRVLDIVTPGLLADEGAFEREMAATASINQLRTLLGASRWDSQREQEFSRLLDELDRASRGLSPDDRQRVDGFLEEARSDSAGNAKRRLQLSNDALDLTVIQRTLTRARALEVGESRKRVVHDELVSLDAEEQRAIQGGKMVSVSESSMYQALDKFLRQFFSFVHRRQLASCLPALIGLMRRGMMGARTWEARETDEVDPQAGNIKQLSDRERKACEKFADLYGLLPRDTKTSALQRILDELRGEGSSTKAIVFTHWIPTFRHLAGRLSGQEDVHVIAVDPSSSDQDVEVAVARFARRRDFSILLATDILREGLDLQSANCVVNYDFSYNPQDLEQRIGRVDRIGQESPEIRIVNLMIRDSLDQQVYDKALKRIDVFRATVGDMRPIVEDMARKLESSGAISETDVGRAVAELKQQEDLMNHPAFAGVEEALDSRIQEAHRARNSGLDSLNWMPLAKFFEVLFPSCVSSWDVDQSTLIVSGLPPQAPETLRILAGHRDSALVDSAIGVALRPEENGYEFRLGGGTDALPAHHPIIRAATLVLSNYYGVREGEPAPVELLAMPAGKLGLDSRFVELVLCEFRFAGDYARHRSWIWWGVQDSGESTVVEGVDTARMLTSCAQGGHPGVTAESSKRVWENVLQGANPLFQEWTRSNATKEIAIKRLALQAERRGLTARIRRIEEETAEVPSGKAAATLEHLRSQLSRLSNDLEILDSEESIKNAAANAAIRVVLIVHRGGT